MASPVWQFYKVKEEDNKFAVCNVCAKEIHRGGSLPKNFNTTNLIRHLSDHGKEYDEYKKLARAKAEKAEKEKQRAVQKPLAQLTVTDSMKRKEPYSNDSKKQKELNTKVMEFICLDHQPLSVVGDAGFKRLVSSLDPRYTLPGRKYFTDVCLPELYMTVYKHIDSLMKDDNIVSISFTSDIWSSSVSPLSMLSLTAQFIDANFELQRVVLHSQEFSGSHTAETIAGAFKAMFLAWGIPQRKVHVILRDNARNMEKAMRDALYPSLPCMAHTLQLAVHEGILAQRTIKDIIAMGRRIVGHFKHSQLSYSKLFAIQKVVNGPDQQPKRLHQDVPTRWNSTVAMLKSLLEQKRALCSYAADYDDLPPLFTGSQWKLVENVITLLEPFEELTNKISKATASAADVIPSVRALIRLLEKTQDTDHGVKTTKDTLLEAVKRRFSTIESEELYTLATILDPR